MGSDTNESNSHIKNVFIIPSYRELVALPTQLECLADYLTVDDIIIVADDSGVEFRSEIVRKCQNSLVASKAKVAFSFSDKKSGRGLAVRRSMSFAVENFPNIISIIESDADGSHRVQDILAVRELKSNSDLIVGSRYLSTSEIFGWSLSRKLLSRGLNMIIPKILNLPMTDVTNGLRRYSPTAVKTLLSVPPLNSGFIYLSEQALIIKNNNLSIQEIPITFLDRTHGKSTVTWLDLLNSLRGIFRLLQLKKQFQIVK